MTKLTGQQIADEKLDGWAYLAGYLQTRIATPDFATGLTLVNAIGAAAEEMNHHPDVNLRYTSVGITLISHDIGRVTERDVRLARRISELAAAAGLTLDASLSRLDIGLDSPSPRPPLEFYAAVLGAEVQGEDVSDPHGTLPDLWFQKSGSEEPRQRWHFDVWVDPSQVQPRIEAALAAGGTLVDDTNAPRFWVLADSEGNRMCFCTWQGRS